MFKTQKEKIYIVSKWEKGWMEPRVEIQQWLQTAKAYEVDKLIMTPIKNVRGDLEEYEDVGKALEACPKFTRVFLEPIKNQKIIKNKFISLNDFKHPKSCIYVFGNAPSGNSDFIKKEDQVVYIPTPYDADLWGIVALGIVLYDRNKKWQSL